MSDDSDDGDYAVGRGKPPKSRQFQKGGKPGNPLGRPKGSRNRHTVIRKVLAEMVPAQMGGKKRRIAASEAAVRVLTQKALKGEIAAIRDVLQLWAETEEAAQTAREAEYPFSDADCQVIAEMHARMTACEEPGT